MMVLMGMLAMNMMFRTKEKPPSMMMKRNAAWPDIGKETVREGRELLKPESWRMENIVPVLSLRDLIIGDEGRGDMIEEKTWRREKLERIENPAELDMGKTMRLLLELDLLRFLGPVFLLSPTFPLRGYHHSLTPAGPLLSHCLIHLPRWLHLPLSFQGHFIHLL